MSSVVASEGCFTCSHRLCSFLHRDGHKSTYRTVQLRRGERLETGPGTCLKFWVVISGTAAICSILPDGRRQITGIETAGDAVCGPMAKPDNPIWLEALDHCSICELDFSADARELRGDPQFLTAMFDVIHKRLEDASRHLTTLGRLDSMERVILFLAEMALPAGEGRPVQLPMSREDIADYLGLNTETVSRIFSRIRKSKLLIFLSPTEYVVPDWAAIEKRLPVSLHKPVDKPMGSLPGQNTAEGEKRA